MFCKMICNLIFHLFHVDLQIHQNTLVVGKDIGNKNYIFLIIILNNAQYEIINVIKDCQWFCYLPACFVFFIQVVANIVFKVWMCWQQKIILSWKNRSIDFNF